MVLIGLPKGLISDEQILNQWMLILLMRKLVTDRYIPKRKGCTQLDMQTKNKEESRRGKQQEDCSLSMQEIYQAHILSNNTHKLVQFKQNNPQSQSLFPSPKIHKNTSKRSINKIPFKVLDAPNLQDDFYLNLVEWGNKNILAVALGSAVYLWSAITNKVIKFCQYKDKEITSLTWHPKGDHLAIGNNSGEIQIWDCYSKISKFQNYKAHSGRIGSLAWSNQLLCSGSRDHSILFKDIRQNTEAKRVNGHSQQVCGLKWSYDFQKLASGGNDNKLIIWSAHSSIPLAKFSSHCAAVKAIAWSPHLHGLLLSGGGSADRTIKFWNTQTYSQIDSIDTGSQVCNLAFSKSTNEFISTHGYSQNEVICWKYPTLQKVITLTGHGSRVLYLSVSPDGENIVTGAGDETLRFWSVFPHRTNSNNQSVLVARDLR